MIIFLLILPLLTLVSALALYQHNGKREILRFDLVQFVYSFVMAPALFVWMKSFLFYLLRNELDFRLSVTEMFVIDSIFSTLFLFVYGFVVIHSLTKSFRMKKMIDPLYDIFLHSEYFHLWLSHLIIFGGGILLITIFSLVNSIFPYNIILSKAQFYTVVGSGVVSGIGVFLMVWLSNPLQGNFMRIMKLLFGLAFLAHVTAYFIIDPRFNSSHVIYWMTFMATTTLVICSLVFHRSERAKNLVERLKDYKWGINLDVLKQK